MDEYSLYVINEEKKIGSVSVGHSSRLVHFKYPSKDITITKYYLLIVNIFLACVNRQSLKYCKEFKCFSSVGYLPVSFLSIKHVEGKFRSIEYTLLLFV